MVPTKITPTTPLLHCYSSEELLKKTTIRERETKLGQQLSGIADKQESKITTAELRNLLTKLKERKQQGARFVILGVPEDIGPRANGGRRGADKAWEAFLNTFLNIQANQFINPKEILLLGEIETTELQKQALNLSPQSPADLLKLRELCEQLDDYVAPIVEAVITAELELIVIGGGHNNVYPIHQGIKLAQQQKKVPVGLACLNCDPHADFRPIEGRHSGNGFTFSHQAGILKHYQVLGLHESYNSETILNNLATTGSQFITYEDIKIRRRLSWSDAIDQSCCFLKEKNLPVGLELDVDAIAFLPTSAETPNGFSSEETAQALYTLAKRLPNILYLHLPEGAPECHANKETGMRYVGRTLLNQVLAYIKGRTI